MQVAKVTTQLLSQLYGAHQDRGLAPRSVYQIHACLSSMFTDAADGSVPWKPTMVTRYFQRLRARAGLEHVDFHDLRKFMETYGQEAGYSCERSLRTAFRAH